MGWLLQQRHTNFVRNLVKLLALNGVECFSPTL